MAVWETLFSKNKKNLNDNFQKDLQNPKLSDLNNLSPIISTIVISSENPFFTICKTYSLNKEQDSFSLNLISSINNFEFASNNKSEDENILKNLNIAANNRLNQISKNETQNNLKDLDEEIFVYISNNKMLAWIFIFPPIGNGNKLTSSKILQKLIDYGVSFGIDFDLLQSIPQDEKRYSCLYLVSCGKTPVDGEDGYVVELYHPEIYLNIENNEISHVDYAHLNLSRRIPKGGVICEIVPPTAGISGITVTRDLLSPPPKDGQAAFIPKGRNTCLSKDGRYLIAEKSGNVAYSGKNFQVKPILEIFHDVKLNDEQHDINFLGDVHIHGDVLSGVTIRATGDVHVDGVVESCSIEAGENIIVLGGVQGQYNASLRSHKGIYARYLEHCDVYAQEIVQADCIIDCNIYSNGTVTARTGLGVIICGTIHSSREISAKTVGSKAGIQTNIIIGGFPCDEVEKEQIIAELNDINKKIETISSQPKSPNNNDALSKLRLNQCVAKMKLDKFEKDFKSYYLSIHENDNRFLICDKVYPGACITIEESFLEIESEKSNCLINLNKDGNISCIDNNKGVI